MQKRYEAEQAARGQEGDASDGGNHGCVEEHWHITTLAGSWQGRYRADRAWKFAKRLNSVKAEIPLEANRRNGHIAGEFCQSRNTF